MPWKGNSYVKSCEVSWYILLDSSLSGESLVSSIYKKASQRLSFLYRNKDCMSFSTRKTLALALIQCHIDYACVSWYESLTKKLKSK